MNTEFDYYVRLINLYIKFYKYQIEDTNLLDGINCNDMSSTNLQLELFYEEMNKYKLNDTIKVLYDAKQHSQKTYTIIKNNLELLLTSESLISILIEIINLENETSDDYNVIYKS